MFIFLVGVLLYSGCATHDALYISSARMRGFTKSGATIPSGAAMLASGHFIEDGSCLVILIRDWTQGGLFVSDSSRFSKLTLEVCDYLSGETRSLPDDGIHLYYSDGGSAWILKGSGVYANNASGKVTITDVSGSQKKLQLKIDVALKAANSLSSQNMLVIEKELILQSVELEKLTPWLGMPTDNYLESAFPK